MPSPIICGAHEVSYHISELVIANLTFSSTDPHMDTAEHLGASSPLGTFQTYNFEIHLVHLDKPSKNI